MLQISKLTAGYGGPPIIHDVHLSVLEKEIVTIIGPNGAGKSTVLRSIFGLTEISDGSIRFLSQELVGLKTKDIAYRGISYVTQGRAIFPNLTVEENLEMGTFMLTDKKQVDGSGYFPRSRGTIHQYYLQ